MTSCISKQCLKSSLSGCSLSFGKAGSSLLCGLFSSCGDRGHSLYVVCRLLAETTSLVSELELRGMCGLQWSQHVGSVVAAPRLWSPGSAVAARGLSSCGSQALEPGLSSCCCTGLVALQNVGSSWPRDWTCVSCTGRWILYQGSPHASLFIIF